VHGSVGPAGRGPVGGGSGRVLGGGRGRGEDGGEFVAAGDGLDGHGGLPCLVELPAAGRLHVECGGGAALGAPLAVCGGLLGDLGGDDAGAFGAGHLGHVEADPVEQVARVPAG